LIHEVLKKITNQPPTKDELSKSKNLLLGNVFRTIDNSHELPRLLACEEIHFDNQNSLINYVEKINSLNELDVVEVANKYFQDKNYSMATLSPKK